MELFRSSTSTTTHLTQLAATNTTNLCNIFLPILPTVLVDLLDRYRVGNLLEAMKIIREDQQTFLFRDETLVSEAKRFECVQEKKAMELFFKYLEHVGPNIVLVGVDEDSIGVLLQKLESHNANKFLQSVVGYTWWKRILGLQVVARVQFLELDCKLDEFYASEIGISENHANHNTTCPIVASKLREAARFIALDMDRGWTRKTKRH